MTPARSHPSTRSTCRAFAALVACAAGASIWACSLNPQPIPPGFSDSLDAGNGGDSTAIGPFNGTDSGTGGGDRDTGVPSPGDAADGADAGDAAVDALSDAPSDAADGAD